VTAITLIPDTYMLLKVVVAEGGWLQVCDIVDAK
jgi:hypothetical protein